MPSKKITSTSMGLIWRMIMITKLSRKAKYLAEKFSLFAVDGV
jgi:hypothetical protein